MGILWFHAWFWPHDIGVSHELVAFFPRLKTARFIPDKSRQLLSSCMAELEGYKYERRSRPGIAKQYIHRISLRRPESNHPTTHPALRTFLKLRSQIAISAPFPEQGLPPVIRIVHKTWRKEHEHIQWLYLEQVFNEFLRILGRSREELETTEQIVEALRNADFAMVFGCADSRESEPKQDALGRASGEDQENEGDVDVASAGSEEGDMYMGCRISDIKASYVWDLGFRKGHRSTSTLILDHPLPVLASKCPSPIIV